MLFLKHLEFDINGLDSSDTALVFTELEQATVSENRLMAGWSAFSDIYE